MTADKGAAPADGLVERLERTTPQSPIDNHGGYGQCGGFGEVWVDDGDASNWYRGGLCARCAPKPKPLNPDGPEAGATITRLRAERDEARGLLRQAIDGKSDPATDVDAILAFLTRTEPRHD